ncbi:MAG: tRNA epoxyqueuosine(34) reductase QueG [Pseudomonadales bacterium]|nr:tRNA epoxyqueuosine(34) reductase QueG [Pseudomonadales bacterium]MBO6597385.1 tRNA epoxyqueuosine(34) reductase QueG [Pseudomonadales bacterium]MBO6657283.1 tRNA epoxyqueuosine(34) reductase QueG [Pseudomonadales bacterium]MBO6703120.1 tRNA epoxyqueuosine(34) reductase QueG [Pseudomonadales bacterium]MBO6824119.1 tRNA epoxyqueuosine(34) reductase QueG [Pseudomonadales bacterium]
MPMQHVDWNELAEHIQTWARELGFSAAGMTDVDLTRHGEYLKDWLAADFHGDMEYMKRHDSLRWHPEDLHPGTVSIVSVRIDYLEHEPQATELLDQEGTAYVSRYALGRDYHKVIRGKLKKLVARISDYCLDQGIEDFQARVFTDSAPLLEKAIAEKAGLGWIGKNTLLINEKAGSWFFLGEVLTNLPLPSAQEQARNRCGSCSACIDICPTDAIVEPYRLDARKCISYLTIEQRGMIPEEYRKAMGNRVFGCDDCQLVCPWNRYAGHNQESDFKPRHGLEDADLLELFGWSEATFLKNTEGSAIRRTGYEGWLRNLAVALGNMKTSSQLVSLLRSRLGYSDLVDEHIKWALKQHRGS